MTQKSTNWYLTAQKPYLCPFLPLNDGILVCVCVCSCLSPASDDALESGRDGESNRDPFELDVLPTRLNFPADISDGALGIRDGRWSGVVVTVYPAVPPSPPLIGTLRSVFSRIFIIGPGVPVVGISFACRFFVNALIESSACVGRDSGNILMLRRPFARHGSCLWRNSSNDSHPPPTRTITVDRRIRTIRLI
ncbi:hypothetical protein GCK72_003223 [Caenorhabditis remanei]|uniref:Uncharacterized protein n=1 Tax=Caenorhabditis remanei TaxID=31234 RepID=A0A6A5HXU3_CAERE|nr:hypothetical protein GCK72_003223 [Caenorhabditis remanei]KAF1771397.1 hypothetical protein GCK72_003223 [Caenorhabditis remanei]